MMKHIFNKHQPLPRLMRRPETKHDQQGFTLPELLVVIAVVGILSLVLANFIANWLQASTLAQARADLVTNAELALDAVAEDIRLSGSVDENNRWPDANGPGGNQFGWASTGQVLVLAKIATDEFNNAIYSDPAQYITQKINEVYYVSNGTLYRRTLASDDINDNATTTCPPASVTTSCPADRTIATGVTAFAVTYYDANDQVVTAANARAVQLSITVARTQNTKTIQASYTTRMVFRNE